jgi:hypothetical protein
MPPPPSAPRRLILALAATLLTAGCDEPTKPAGAPSASATAAPAPPPPAPEGPIKFKTMPDLAVDAEGPFLGGQRIDLAQNNGPEKLAEVIKGLPIDGKPVTLLVDRKAKTPLVAVVVTALGKAGAPKVMIKTDGRNDLPKEIGVTPETRVSSPPACAIASMVLKDLSTAIWPVKGGLGKRQRKGLAGPDLTSTGDELKKEIAGCDSTMAFFSGEDTIPWELTFNLAGTVLTSDEKKKVDTLVLLHEAPVAGRAIVIGKTE